MVVKFGKPYTLSGNFIFQNCNPYFEKTTDKWTVFIHYQLRVYARVQILQIHINTKRFTESKTADQVEIKSTSFCVMEKQQKFHSSFSHFLLTSGFQHIQKQISDLI